MHGCDSLGTLLVSGESQGTRPATGATRDSLDPGAAFRVKGKKRYFEPFSSPRGEFQCLSSDVVGVQKRDVITAAGARCQKWRLLSVDVAERLGGQWIARSLHSLDGTLVRALMYVGR